MTVRIDYEVRAWGNNDTLLGVQIFPDKTWARTNNNKTAMAHILDIPAWRIHHTALAVSATTTYQETA